MITYEDFRKVELKIAKITEVKEHPDADRLYLVTIDLGGEQTKQIVAGIRNSYTKESLIGRQVVVVDNLEPAVIRGQASQAMLLAAQDENGITIITTEKEVKPGSIVK